MSADDAALHDPTLRRLVQLPRAELWGLADQGLASGVNFLSVILLARVLPPSEFGYYVLAFTLLQLATTLQTALVTRPHNVLGARREGEAYRRYTRTAAVAQFGLAVGLALLLALWAMTANAFGISEASVFLAAVPAIAAWQLQEFGRRVLYTEHRIQAAFANDLVTYGGQAAVLGILWRFDSLTATSALYALALTTAVGAFVASLQLRRSLAGTFDRSSIGENWSFGRWLAAAEVGYWFSSGFYLYLAALVLSPAASGALKAAQTLLGPISVFQAFFLSYLPVKFAHALGRPQGERLREQLTRAWGAIGTVTVSYCVLVAVLAEPILTSVYGEEYGGEVGTVRMFGVYYILLSFSLVVVSIVTARRLARQIFVAHAAGAVASLMVAWPLLEAFGPTGAVVGMIVSWAVSTLLLWRTHRVWSATAVKAA